MSSTSDIGYVLLPRDKAQTSSEARQIVTERLEKYRSFYMDNLTKLPFIPFFDWMEIGGEFTGALYPNGIREKFLDKAKNLIDDYGNNENVIKANHKKLDSLWNELGGKGQSPLTREQICGADDDACIFESWLAKELNHAYRTIEHNQTDYDFVSKVTIGLSTALLMPLVIVLHDDFKHKKHLDFNHLVGKYWVAVINFQCA